MLKTNDLKIVDAETETTIGLIQWFRLEASVHSFAWKATWERKRRTEQNNVMLLRSTDLTEAWFILDTYEGEVAKIDCDENAIYVKNYKVISTRAEVAKADETPKRQYLDISKPPYVSETFVSENKPDDHEPMAMRWGEN
jgi:hypothetical protein